MKKIILLLICMISLIGKDGELRTISLDDCEKPLVKSLKLLTRKAELFICKDSIKGIYQPMDIGVIAFIEILLNRNEKDYEHVAPQEKSQYPHFGNRLLKEGCIDIYDSSTMISANMISAKLFVWKNTKVSFCKNGYMYSVVTANDTEYLKKIFNKKLAAGEINLEMFGISEESTD